MWKGLARRDQRCAKQRKQQRQASRLHAKSEQSNYWEISVKLWTWETTPHWGRSVPHICCEVNAQCALCQTSSISSKWFNFTNTGWRFENRLKQASIYVLCKWCRARRVSVKCFHIIPFWILGINYKHVCINLLVNLSLNGCAQPWGKEKQSGLCLTNLIPCMCREKEGQIWPNMYAKIKGLIHQKMKILTLLICCTEFVLLSRTLSEKVLGR